MQQVDQLTRRQLHSAQSKGGCCAKKLDFNNDIKARLVIPFKVPGYNREKLNHKYICNNGTRLLGANHLHSDNYTLMVKYKP